MTEFAELQFKVFYTMETLYKIIGVKVVTKIGGLQKRHSLVSGHINTIIHTIIHSHHSHNNNM